MTRRYRRSPAGVHDRQSIAGRSGDEVGYRPPDAETGQLDLFRGGQGLPPFECSPFSRIGEHVDGPGLQVDQPIDRDAAPGVDGGLSMIELLAGSRHLDDQTNVTAGGVAPAIIAGLASDDGDVRFRETVWRRLERKLATHVVPF